MAAPPTKPGKYCMLDPSPPMVTFNTARSNQVSMTLVVAKRATRVARQPDPFYPGKKKILIRCGFFRRFLKSTRGLAR